MAGKRKTADGKAPAKSPINGQPVPNGKLFTSETAREAAKKSAESRKRDKCITEAFLKLLTESFTDAKTGKTHTGAEILANSILKGANNGNPKMVEIALALNGETPSANGKAAASELTDDPISAALKKELGET